MQLIVKVSVRSKFALHFMERGPKLLLSHLTHKQLKVRGGMFL